MGFILNGNNEINCKIHVTEDFSVTFNKANRTILNTINNMKAIKHINFGSTIDQINKLGNAFSRVNTKINRTVIAFNKVTEIAEGRDKLAHKLSRIISDTTSTINKTLQNIDTKAMDRTTRSLNKFCAVLERLSVIKIPDIISNSFLDKMDRTAGTINNLRKEITALNRYKPKKEKEKEKETKPTLLQSLYDSINKFKENKIVQALSSINVTQISQKIIDFVSTSLEASRMQANAELQLNVVLNNRGIISAFDEIKKKAEQLQSIGFFKDDVIMAGASKLSSYLKDVKAITKMMDIMSNYATGVSGGKPVNARQMVQYATLLGRAMQGSFMGMLRYGFKFNEAQQAILKGIATESQYIQVLGKNYRDLSEDMRKVEIVGQVINNSWGNLYQTMSNTPFGKLEQLKNSLTDISEIAGNKLLPSVNDLLNTIQKYIPSIKDAISSISEALSPFISTISVIIDGVLNILSHVLEKVKEMSPEFMATIGVLSAVTLAVTVFIQAIVAFLSFLATPLGTVIAIIVGIVLLYSIMINKINKVQNKSISAVGIITGTLYALWTTVKNIFGRIWDIIAPFIEFFINCWENPVAAGKAAFFRLLEALANIFADIVNIAGKAVSKVADLFVDKINPLIKGWNEFAEVMNIGIKLKPLEKGFVSSAIDDTVSSIRKAANKSGEVAAKEEGKIKNKVIFDRISQKSVKDAYKEGYDWGANLNKRAQNIQGVLDNADLIDDIADSTGRTADGTDKINDKLTTMEEDLKYMRDLAEREAINRFTTAEIKVDMTNNNAINSEMDIDGVINILTEKLNEQLNTQVIGVYNY